MTGQKEETLLALLQGASPASRELLGTLDEVSKLCEAFEEDENARKVLESGIRENPEQCLKDLMLADSRVGTTLRKWLEKYDHFVISGYDGADPTYGECPAVVLQYLKTIISSQKKENKAKQNAKDLITKFLEELVPSKHRLEFEQLLCETAEMVSGMDFLLSILFFFFFLFSPCSAIHALL